ncbi:glycosyl transferase [Caldovatus sediminis]|uniref:Glycosyl transferase n=1 Tax=Caldovatus sediminis TaxID=2041189 RepID=A0A8J3ED70_9PROT|nr:glycosyltransferase family 9 protein [Caldovatus sediminis]GGG41596.1 glycosyl transferase [Caldovatus sediminis]
MGGPVRILFVTASRLGDAVLSTGLLDHLIRSHPEARITVACGPVAEGVFARMPNRARTVVLAKRRYRAHWLGLLAAAAPVRWDLVVDLRGSALAWMLWTRRRAVMRGGRRPGHRIGHLAAVLGLRHAPPLPVAWTAEADRARAAALLPEGAGVPWIGLGPTANWPRKVWPAERFLALFRALSAPDGPLPGARAAVFGGPGEAERALAAPLLAALPPGSADLVGRLQVPEAAAALGRCALFVGNDSGLMHLSAAVGTPTLGLFGPTSAEEYGPVGARAAAVTAPGAPGAGEMAAITVADALAAARRLLDGPPRAALPGLAPVPSAAAA